MGKSNRIRTKRAEDVITKSVSVKKTKKSSPSWLYSLIAAVFAVVVIAVVVVSLYQSSGAKMRNTIALESDNYEVNGNMFSYIFANYYQEFMSTNQNYLQYYSLDTEKSLKEQMYGDTSNGSPALETTQLGEFKGTWYDYFMSKAISQTREVLIYCEEAKARGIELGDDENTQIETMFLEIDIYAQLYGYTRASYIASMYGEGVKEKDIREYLELELLAAKCVAEIGNSLMDAITDEQISAKYEANKLDYDIVDMNLYEISVNYSTVAKDVVEGYDGKAELTDEQKATVLEAYKKEIEDAKKKAETYAAITDPNEFEKKVIEDIANQEFDSFYDVEALAEADALSPEALAAVKEAMIAKLVAEVYSGVLVTSDDTVEKDGTYTAYEQTVTENAAKALDSIKAKLFSTLTANKEDNFVEGYKNVEDEAVSIWAFDAARKVGETNTIETGDGSNGTDVENKLGYFKSAIYIMKKTAYRDEEVSRRLGYMTFTSEDNAKKAIAAFENGKEFTEDAFLKAATDNSASSAEIIGKYLEGYFGYSSVDDWLYSASVTKGSYTKTPILLDAPDADGNNATYGVFFYIDDDDMAWEISVSETIYNENADITYAELYEKHKVTVNEEAIEKISA